jgi:uncharacterized protein (TIGR02466 family)
MIKKEISIIPLFAMPVMSVMLDLDLEKLIEFVLQNKNENFEGCVFSNKGGWHSKELSKSTHEEFLKLKEQITDQLQRYHSEVFVNMKFKGNMTASLGEIWAGVNEKHHYNDWHVHPFSTLSGVYYIKHDGSPENGVISFKHPEQNIVCPDMHWPLELIEVNNEISAGVVDFLPKAGKLLIFPSWLQHKVEANLKDSVRISISFNSTLSPEIV